MKSFGESKENQQLKEQLDQFRMKDTQKSATMNLLRKVSKELVKALRLKSKMIIKMAKIIKKLEKSLQNLTRQIVTVTSSKA